MNESVRAAMKIYLNQLDDYILKNFRSIDTKMEQKTEESQD